MRISYNWLKKYVDIKLPSGELKQLLTMSGLSVESVEESHGDHIFEIEITSNRPDWLSVIGVAREVAALTGKKAKVPSVPPIRVKSRQGKAVSIKIEDKTVCPKYTARIIRGVNVQGSPEWLKSRLEAIGVRSINNIVDITNFCLFETGEPMHAFDLDKIEGRTVIVRKARKGEKLKTIDGVERVLDESMIVIADSKKPIALAGIMGGLDTEVTDSTRNILLEAASFDPISIRRASRKFAISTESSYRFERKVAIETIEYASRRATDMIAELAGGTAEDFLESGDKPKAKRLIAMRLQRLYRLLGVEIPPSKVRNILTALGLKMKGPSTNVLTAEVPDFRNDLASEVDCIEEVARVYGYDKVPETIPGIVNQPDRLEKNRVIAKNIRRILASAGASEIITYSLVSRKSLAASQCDHENVAEVRNPISSEQEIMRPGLLAGMLNAMLWNINRKNKNLKLFELGNIYRKIGEDKFEEIECLSIAVSGEIASGWETASRPATFYDLKGLCEAVFNELDITGYSFDPSECRGLAAGACARITLNGETIGSIGEADPVITHEFDIKDKIYFCQILTGPLYQNAVLKREFKAIPRYPSVYRDISIIVDKDALHADLVSCISRAAGAILKSIELIDRYKGKQISGDKISITYRLEYQDPVRTLEEKDIQDVRARVLEALADRFGAKLR